MTPREPDRFDCHECGVGVKVDEDGCCATCGRDAIEVVDGLPVGPLRDVYHAPPSGPVTPAPLLPRVLAVVDVDAKHSSDPALIYLAAELRAYIAEMEGKT